jgi:hypothetical protein
MPQPRLPFSSQLAVIVGGLLLLVFIGPPAGWWSQNSLHWATPYGLWLALILLALLIHRRDHSDEP